MVNQRLHLCNEHIHISWVIRIYSSFNNSGQDNKQYGRSVSSLMQKNIYGCNYLEERNTRYLQSNGTNILDFTFLSHWTPNMLELDWKRRALGSAIDHTLRTLKSDTKHIWHGEIQLLQLVAMWKISKVRIHSTHCCDQIAFTTDLYSILRATADKISLKPLTQFWITGSHERVSCFPSVSHLNKKYREWDGIILLKFVFCGRECVKWHIRFFSFPFLSSDISREVWLQNAVRVLSYTPEVHCVPSSCRLMLHRPKLQIRSITFKNSEDTNFRYHEV